MVNDVLTAGPTKTLTTLYNTFFCCKLHDGLVTAFDVVVIEMQRLLSSNPSFLGSQGNQNISGVIRQAIQTDIRTHHG